MDGAPPEEVDFSKLPIEERLISKNWKARVSAYTTLIHDFKTSISEDAPEFGPYLRDPTILRNAIIDTNAIAQEQGILCACAFIEFGGKSASSKARESFTSALVEKNIFGSTRAGSKKAAIELCLLLVECEGTADGVFEACMEGLKSKQPKAVAGSVTAIKEIIRQFGARTVNVKPVLKVVPLIFAHSDKGVRAEGTSLVQELHKWIGTALEPHLGELKPVQQKELIESFVSLEKPTQLRYTRQQQRERALREAEASLTANATQNLPGDGRLKGPFIPGAAAEETEESPPDAYDFAEPQNILDRLPEAFYENLASSKWKERKEGALDPLLEMLKKTPKLQDANYDELVRQLSAKMSDANIACVIASAGCLECLARGLRTAFGRYKPLAFPLMLERCKEKKASVIDALANALDAICESVTISDILEDISTFAKHKNPQVKEQAFKVLNRALCTGKSAFSLKTDFKPLTDALLPGLDDSTPVVREAAAQALGTLNKVVGDRPMAAVLDGLDDIKRKKISEYAGKAVIKHQTRAAASVAASEPILRKVTSGPYPSTKSLVSKERTETPSRASDASDKENALPSNVMPHASQHIPQHAKTADNTAPLRKPPVLSSMKKASQASKAPQASAAKVVPAVTKALPSEPLKYKYTSEEAEQQAENAVPAGIYQELSNSNWKLRLAAMDELLAWLDADGATAEPELIVRLLSKRPGWKESNFQVYSKMANVFQTLAQGSRRWSRACSALTIGPVSDKLGDIKLKKTVGDLLTVYAETFSLQFVLSHAYDNMTNQKAPKAQADALLWIEQSLRDFGIQGIAIRDLIDFLKIGLKSSNANVRVSATKALVTLRLFAGAEIKTFIQDLNPTLLTSIEQDFDKVSTESAPVPTRYSADNARSESASRTNGNVPSGDALDDLFPRQDVTRLVPASTIKAISDANWKQRKEALESIQGILEQNKRLKPNLGDLPSALKLRLPDSNKIVQGLVLDIITRLAAGVDKPFEKHARIFVGPICSILADAKINVRAPAITCLSAIHDACGLDSMLAPIAAGLEIANPVQRAELATWLGTKLSEQRPTLDLGLLIGPTLLCLEDKTSDVRKAAQTVLPHIVANVGYQAVVDRTASLKPASRSSLMPVLEAAKQASSAVAPSGQSRRTTSKVDDVMQERISKTTAADVIAHLPKSTAPPSRILSATTRNIKTLSSQLDKQPARLPLKPVTTPSKSAPYSSGIETRVGKNGIVMSGNGDDTSDFRTRRSIDSTDVFTTSNTGGKLVRSARETGPLKWNVQGSARPDQIEYLYQQMYPVTDEHVLSLLFSKDHNGETDHLAGLAAVSKAIPVNVEDANSHVARNAGDLQTIIANADLILKYISLRLADNHTSITLRCLEVAEGLVTAFQQDGSQLSDYEAGILLPALIAKLSDSKEAIRGRIRSLLRSVGGIYPTSKIFVELSTYGSVSASARVRLESLQEMGSLISRHGISTYRSTRTVLDFGKYISDKDSSCQAAALDALATVYSQVGKEIYQMLGDTLAPKEAALLDERLKRISTAAHRAQGDHIAAPGDPVRAVLASSDNTRPESRGSINSVPEPSKLRAAMPDKRRRSALPTPTSTLGYREVSPQPAGWATPVQLHLHNDSSHMSSEHEHLGAWSTLATEDVAASVDALKQVQRSIVENPSALSGDADTLMAALTVQMKFAFSHLSQSTPQATLRLCKHLMQTLSGFFDQKELSLAVSESGLTTVLAELTRRLLDTANNSASEAIVSLSKVLNMVLIRIFHNSDSSSCFGALFNILRDSTIELRALDGKALDAQFKYAELVMKCLWKVSKSVKDNLEDGSLNPKELLLDIDRFLQAIPPAEWRRRATDEIPLGDMPLRTVKTILQQVVSTFGDNVYEHLSLIDRPESSFVYQYLYRLLNNARTQGRDRDISRAPSVSSQRRTNTDARYANESPANGGSAAMSPGRSNDIEMNLALKAIFEKIGKTEDSKRGIAELYQFRKEHPDAEPRINIWISETGSYFQAYVKRGLANLAVEDSERVGSADPTSPASSRPVSVFPDMIGSPQATGSPRPGAPVEGGDAGTASPHTNSPRARSSRVTSGSSLANDDRLDSLKQMFGVRK